MLVGIRKHHVIYSHVTISTEPCHGNSRASRTLLCFKLFAIAGYSSLIGGPLWSSEKVLGELGGCTNFLYSLTCSDLATCAENGQSIMKYMNLF